MDYEKDRRRGRRFGSRKQRRPFEPRSNCRRLKRDYESRLLVFYPDKTERKPSSNTSRCFFYFPYHRCEARASALSGTRGLRIYDAPFKRGSLTRFRLSNLQKNAYHSSLSFSPRSVPAQRILKKVISRIFDDIQGLNYFAKKKKNILHRVSFLRELDVSDTPRAVVATRKLSLLEVGYVARGMGNGGSKEKDISPRPVERIIQYVAALARGVCHKA